MASEIDISNTALSYLGDAANVSSIDPPEGSAQAEHCARFYPIARDALLEMHDWGFATRRVALAQLANPTTQWAYCYAQPNNMVNPIAVLASDGLDDTSVAMVSTVNALNGQVQGITGVYTPQPFVLEIADDGTDIIYTNQENATLRYVARVTDTSKFSPLFTLVLGRSLASMLAGPVVKGREGSAESARQFTIAFGQDGKSGLFGKAVSSDANQKRSTTRDRQQVAWLNGR